MCDCVHQTICAQLILAAKSTEILKKKIHETLQHNKLSRHITHADEQLSKRKLHLDGNDAHGGGPLQGLPHLCHHVDEHS